MSDTKALIGDEILNDLQKRVSDLERATKEHHFRLDHVLRLIYNLRSAVKELM